MKVSELIIALQQIDPETDVLVSSDPEGNNYSLLEVLVEGNYIITYSGDLELERSSDSEEDCNQDAKPCVILYP